MMKLLDSILQLRMAAASQSVLAKLNSLSYSQMDALMNSFSMRNIALVYDSTSSAPVELVVS